MKLKTNKDILLDKSRERDNDITMYFDETDKRTKVIYGKVRQECKLGDTNPQYHDFYLRSIETYVYGVIYVWYKKRI